MRKHFINIHTFSGQHVHRIAYEKP
jgi:hypothetical protein